MYGLGLIFIFLVAIIWSASSIVAQYLYTDLDFDSPFFLTYIGTSLFILFLPTRLLYERRRRFCFWRRNDTNDKENDEIIPWSSTITQTYEQIPLSTEEDDVDDDNTETVIPQNNNNNLLLLSHYQHVQIAWKIAPLWFFSNWTYNASLEFTSITSSTVLASTGSLFTLVFALLTGDEQFACTSLLGVLLGVLGSSMTAWSDVAAAAGTTTVTNTTSSNMNHDDISWTELNFFETQQQHAEGDHPHNIMGDVLGLLSAVGYGSYTILIRLLCPSNERSYSMQLILGYIGLVNGIALAPILLYQLYMSSTTNLSEELTTFVLGCLVVKGLFDNVLSDYLWARAVLLTSATVATVGTGLTIPLALLTDLLWHHTNDTNNATLLGWRKLLGALSVLVGFVLVNVGGARNGSNNNENRHHDGAENGRSSRNGSVELSFEEAQQEEPMTSIPVI